jgi:lactate dehydrogenase-like 2-hydroxyacid dehydrogenase
MASLASRFATEASGFSPSAHKPATLFSDASALGAHNHKATARVTKAEPVGAAILQLAPRLHAVREPCGVDDIPASQRSLRGLRLGILGRPATHHAWADRLRAAFGMLVCAMASDVEAQQDGAGHGCHLGADADELLSGSDIVVAMGEPGFCIDNKALNAMPPQGVVLADPDAAEIDQPALAHALWFETIAGAGIARSAGACRLLPELANAHNVVRA